MQRNRWVGTFAPLGTAASCLFIAVYTAHCQQPRSFSDKTREAGYSVVSSGPHYRVWSRVTYTRNDVGQLVPVTNSFTELSSGLNRLVSNRWVECKPELVAATNGIIAQGGAHSATFAPNINSHGAIRIKTPQGAVITTHPLCLAYEDSSTATNVYFGLIKDSTAQLRGSNQVVYPDAFSGASANIVYLYKRAGLRQEIRFQAPPPPPQEFNLNPKTTHLVMISEFVDLPQPHIKRADFKAGWETMRDDTIEIGGMRMASGRAFGLPESHRGGMHVAKEWRTMGRRKLLFERIQYAQAQSELERLRLDTNSSGGVTNASFSRPTGRLFARNTLPQSPEPRLTARYVPVSMPEPIPAEPEFVLDWDFVPLDGYFDFGYGLTWVVRDDCYLYGATFGGATTVKFTENSFLGLYGPIDWQGTLGDMFTSVVDGEPGDDIAGDFPDDAGHYWGVEMDDCASFAVAQTRFTVRYSDNGLVLAASCVPTVTITADDPVATKAVTPEDTATFIVSRADGDWNQSLQVYYTISPTTVNGVDFQSLSGSVTIPQGAETAPIVIHPLSSGSSAFENAVSITLQDDPSYLVGSPNAASACIDDPRVPAGPPIAAPSGLVSWWRAENNASDSLGLNNGSILGGVTYVPGIVGQAFHFDGNDGSYVRIPASASLGFADQFTIELWYRAEGSGNQGLVARRNNDSGPLNYEVAVTPGAQIVAFFNDPLVSGDTDQPGCVFELSRAVPAPQPPMFHHLAVSFRQATTSTVEVKTYSDGQLAKTRFFNANLGQAVNSGAAVTIGTEAVYGGWFKGTIDELAMYNRDLLAGEIQSIYNAGRGGKAIPPSIFTQPANQTVSVGANAPFSVTVAGTPPFTYQWRFNGVDISGATSSAYTRPNVQPADAGHYSVTVANAVGSVSSSIALLTLLPNTISGLKLWLKSDAGISPAGGPVQTWADQSGTVPPNNAIQNTSSQRPTWVNNQISGLPVVRFTAAGLQYFGLQNVLSSSSGASGAEAFAVLKASQDLPTVHRALWSFGGGGGFYPSTDGGISDGFASTTAHMVGNPPQALDQFHVYNVAGKDGNWMAGVNGVLQITTGNTYAPNASPNLGFTPDPYSNRYFNGDMAEVLVYNRMLSPEERDAVTGYLNLKYGFSSPQTPSAPGNLAAYAISRTQISLNWRYILPNTSTGFRIERKSGANPYSVLALVRDTTSFLDTSLQTGTTYYYRVRAITTASESDYSNEATATTSLGGADMPLANVKLWLKADAGFVGQGGNSVSIWQDQSGSQNHATQVNASRQPSWIDNQINGRPVVRFNATSSQNLSLPSVLSGSSGASGAEAFAVLKASEDMPGQQRVLWRFGGSTSGDYYPGTSGEIWDDFASTTAHDVGNPPQPLDQFHVYNVGGKDGTWMAAINGVLQSTTPVNTYLAISSPSLGDPPAFRYFNGDVAEILVYNGMLSSDERDAVNRYLQQKYALVTAPPPKPANFTARPISPSQTSLTWSSALGKTSTGFKIERKSGAGGYSQVAIVRDATSFFDSGLAAGTYSYQVKAFNAAGDSPYSNETTVSTLPSGVDVPLASLKIWLKADGGLAGGVGSAPVNFWPDQSASISHATQPLPTPQPMWIEGQANGRPVVRFAAAQNQYLKLPANLLSGLSGAEAFAVLKAAAVQPSSPRGPWQFGSSANGSGGYPGTCDYPNAGGNISDDFASTMFHDVGTPPQPLNQLLVYNVAGQNNGFWMASFNGIVQSFTPAPNNQYGVSSFPLKLGYNGSDYFDGDFAELLIFNRTLTTDERDAVHRYVQQKYGLVTSPPAKPLNLRVQPVSANQISLTWAFPLGKTSTGFIIQRKAGAGSYSQVAVVRDASSFLDTGVSGNTLYTYQVKAFNPAGESVYSDEISATTPATGTDLPLANLKLWLRADAGLAGGAGTCPISFWPDQSGNNNNATQNAISNRVSWADNTFLGRPVLHFDGDGKYFSLPDVLASSSAAEAFIILRTTPPAISAPDGPRGLWKFSRTAADEAFYPDASGNIIEDFASNQSNPKTDPINDPLPQPLNQFHLYNVAGQAGNWMMALDGIIKVNNQANNLYTHYPTPSLGWSGRGLNYFSGDIAELLIYNQFLTTAQRTAVQNYLMNKYVLNDSDGDGIPDWWELQYFGNLTASGTDHSHDNDYDGISDYSEYLKGLNPSHWDGVQNIANSRSQIDALHDADKSVSISFDAAKPGSVTVKFYKFAFQYDSGTHDFAGYNVTYLDQISQNIQPGNNTVTWYGLVNGGQFHTASTVCYEITTTDGTYSDTWSPLNSFVAAPYRGVSVNFKADGQLGKYVPGSPYANRRIPIEVALNPSKPVVVNNAKYQDLMANLSARATFTVSEWFGLSDSGAFASEFDSQSAASHAFTSTISSVSKGAACGVYPEPSDVVSYYNQSGELSNFSVEAYRVSAAQAEVAHAIFDISRQAQITLELYDPALVKYPIYYRDVSGNYVLVKDLDLPAGSYDMEFSPINNIASKLFGDVSMNSGQPGYNGYYRVKIFIFDPRTYEHGFRWATLHLN